MTDTSPAAHVRQIMTVLEEAICLSPSRSLLPPDLARAREHLEKLNAEIGTKQFPDQLFFFYRTGALILRQSEPMTMGKFSDVLGMPLSSATRVVDWLAKTGYVERLTDPADRRIVRVALTEEGHKLYKTINGFIRRRMEHVLRQFTIQERKEMIVLFSKLVAILTRLNK